MEKTYINFKLNSNFYFGKNAIEGLKEVLSSRPVSKLMLVAGGGSIKNGLYEDTIKILKELNIEVVEFWGIKPNPRHDQIDEGARIFESENCQLILPLGGGSVIDAAKAIVMAAANGKKIWPIVTNKIKADNMPSPVIAVITLAATGSENNRNSIVTNELLNEKRGLRDDRLIPIATIEDPKYTYSVSKYQTASGSFDIFSHLLENFYNPKPFAWSQNYIIANMKTLIKNTYIVLKKPGDYDARANILFTSSYALNDLSAFNNNMGSWDVHQLQYPYGAIWDVCHGAALAMLTPEWMRTLKDRKVFYQRTIELGQALFNTNDFDETVQALEKLISDWCLPIKATDFNEIDEVTDKDITKLVAHILNGREKHGHWNLTKTEIINIYKNLK